MDLCHCAHPFVATTDNGSQYCNRCGLWYDEQEWKQDPRVKRVLMTASEKHQQCLEITDHIMKTAKLRPL